MKRRTLIVAVVAASLGGNCSQPYVNFRPVYLRGDHFVASDEPMDQRMHKNIIHVLRLYRVEHRVEANGAILIPQSLANDLETTWNYTIKAADEEWLRKNPLDDARD